MLCLIHLFNKICCGNVSFINWNAVTYSEIYYTMPDETAVLKVTQRTSCYPVRVSLIPEKRQSSSTLINTGQCCVSFCSNSYISANNRFFFPLRYVCRTRQLHTRSTVTSFLFFSFLIYKTQHLGKIRHFLVLGLTVCFALFCFLIVQFIILYLKMY